MSDTKGAGERPDMTTSFAICWYLSSVYFGLVGGNLSRRNTIPRTHIHPPLSRHRRRRNRRKPDILGRIIENILINLLAAVIAFREAKDQKLHRVCARIGGGAVAVEMAYKLDWDWDVGCCCCFVDFLLGKGENCELICLWVFQALVN